MVIIRELRGGPADSHEEYVQLAEVKANVFGFHFDDQNSGRMAIYRKIAVEKFDGGMRCVFEYIRSVPDDDSGFEALHEYYREFGRDDDLGGTQL